VRVCLIIFLLLTDVATGRDSWSTIVIDERLAVLRSAPDHSSKMIRRLSSGRKVTVLVSRRVQEEIFYRVLVTRRTGGWLHSDSVISPNRLGEEARVFEMVRSAQGFELIVKAKAFLKLFPKSTLRPSVLLLLGDAAQSAADRLTLEAKRRVPAQDNYLQNYSGLDRYMRAGIRLKFSRHEQRYLYDGESFREILKKYPHTPQAAEAAKRLNTISASLP
jgi:uncharacterized protein YgiM (DUF1202 family)